MLKMSKELKPCPFCGGEARFRIYDLKGYCGNYEYTIRCDNCNIQFREDDVYQNEIIARQKVIDKWNTRKPIDNIIKELEENSSNYKKSYKTNGKNIYKTVKAISKNRAINIVRKGSVENE